MKTFIRTEFLQDISICDRLINYYNSSDSKGAGTVVGSSGVVRVDPNVKESTDVYLQDSSVAKEYCIELQNIVNNYTKEYLFSNEVAEFGIKDKINIQHYKPGEGFHAWHCERQSGVGVGASRHLVFMTYLNDVQEGGETEFYYQELKIKPQKGLTVIFPSDWTHVHKGITAIKENKYIVTGWFNYLKTN